MDGSIEVGKASREKFFLSLLMTISFVLKEGK